MRAIQARTRTFHTRRVASRRQERFEFALLPDTAFEEVLGRLRQLFHDKCAYCETRLLGQEGLDRFRPKAGALGLKRDFWPDHYWWLAYRWENLYAACAKCNQVKGPKFPVAGKRIRIAAIGKALDREQRLLIDPCLDNPAEDLEFLEDGTVRPRTQKGDVTIGVLELNRSTLVAARMGAALAISSFSKRVPTRALSASLPWKDPVEKVLEALGRGTSDETWAPAIREMRIAVSADGAHAAAARAQVRRWLDQQSLKVGGARGPVRPSSRATRHTRLRTHFLTDIELRNFRGLAELKLTFPPGDRAGAPWVVLLGENGTGKSSILQAIATVLAGSRKREGITLRPSGALRHGALRGHVRLHLSGGDGPLGLAFERGARRFTYQGTPPNRVVLAYGATRLLPRDNRIEKSSGQVRVRNLFDPFRPLLDADRWLGRLDRPTFDYVARALKDVLSLPRSSRLRTVRRRDGMGVQLALFGTPLSLEQLSDGYQSVLGLTCDIIAGLMSGHEGALEAAEGTVLLDELGTHLHPRWRMSIVRSLRKAFPRVQFIVSTHDPLCLRGFEDGEVVVLRRTARGRVYPVPDLPAVKGMRVDQLLTSEFFGLQSTLDPEIEAESNEFYRLLAVRKPTRTQRTRIGELRESLKKHELPGTTRRERRMLELIDVELASIDNEPQSEERTKLRATTNARIAADLNKLLERS